MLKTSRKALSLQTLTKHQERIRGMVQRIDGYKPVFDVNKNYNRNQIRKRIEERERHGDKLFQENLKLIYRLETTGPKVMTRKFPKVTVNPERMRTLSMSGSKVTAKSLSKNKIHIKDVFRNQEELFEENIKIITNIECTGPKIECWTGKKVRKLNQLLKEKKREEQKKILQKFKQISKQLNKITKMRSFKRSSSISSLNNKTVS